MVRRVPISVGESETAIVLPSPPPPVGVSGDTNPTMVKLPVPDAIAPASVPVATVQSESNSTTWQIVFIPMLMSIAIFVLLWSVINGWFERLIF
jgi:hypothetical protein